MPSDPAIRRLAVEAFRGFRDRQEFDINASAVVLAGPNGTGKTSFFDSIQWCLLGSIQRLEGLRSRRNVEHIVNQYRLGDRAAVELELTIAGRIVSVRRTGDHSGSTLEFVEDGRSLFADEANAALEALLAPADGVDLETALSTSGLMQQDVMRGVLEAKPAERYRHISTVLRLGALEDFEEATREAAREARVLVDTAKDERDAATLALEEARSRLATAQSRSEARPRLEALRSDVLSMLSSIDGVRLSVSPVLTTVEEFRTLATEVGNLRARLRAFSQSAKELEDFREALPEAVSQEATVTAQEAFGLAAAAVSEAEIALANTRRILEAAAEAGEAMAQLAALAIPLLSDTCPVCGQPIDPDHVRSELESRLGDTAPMLRFRDDRDRASAELAQAAAARDEATYQLDSLLRAETRWREYAARLDDLQARRTRLHEGEQIVIAESGEEADLTRLASSLDAPLAEAESRLLGALDALAVDVDAGYVERYSAEVDSYSRAIAERGVRLEELSQRAVALKSLSDAAVEARVEVTEARFRAIQPLVADIFSRLDPHPAFKTIEFELDTYYRRGTTSPLVRDLVEGVAADPLLIFSTSQANIAALSYFLAMGWSAGERALPFVLLDDPVQSMDDVNVLGFSDLCRHLRSSRQLVISTHEHRFARLMERKLAPRAQGETTRILDFHGWDRSGPLVEVRTITEELLDRPVQVVRAEAS